MKLPSYIMAFDVKCQEFKANKSNTAKTDCRRGRFVDEKEKAG